MKKLVGFGLLMVSIAAFANEGRGLNLSEQVSLRILSNNAIGTVAAELAAENKAASASKYHRIAVQSEGRSYAIRAPKVEDIAGSEAMRKLGKAFCQKLGSKYAGYETTAQHDAADGAVRLVTLDGNSGLYGDLTEKSMSIAAINCEK